MDRRASPGTQSILGVLIRIIVTLFRIIGTRIRMIGTRIIGTRVRNIGSLPRDGACCSSAGGRYVDIGPCQLTQIVLPKAFATAVQVWLSNQVHY